MKLIEYHLNQYFNIPESQITEWKETSAQQNESLILWILKNKKIDTKKYEDWSFKYYKIPRLKMSYFQKHTLDQSFFTQYQINWPDHVFPLKKWKGVLYLTCLEPVKDINISEEIQWVLAPIEGILFWKKDIKSTSNVAPNAASSINDLNAIDLGSINLSPSKKPVETTTTPLQTSASAHNKTTTVLKTTSMHKPISKPAIPSQKQSLPVIKIKSNTSQVSESYHKESTTTQGQPTQKDIYDVILNRLSVMFDQSMILMFKNSILKPKKWDSSWNKEPSTHNVILLNKPSVFQIVYKTKQKYHGYIAPSTVNDIFFQTWNMGKYPEHLTLLPLIKKNTSVISGMLLGTASKEKGETLSSDKLDILALEASEKLIK